MSRFAPSTSFIRMLLLSGVAAFSSAAGASSELAGALIGAGAGAAIGNSINRHEGAVVGGFIGAVLGAAISDRDRYVVVDRHQPYPRYRPPLAVRHYPPPVTLVKYPPPRVYVVPQPVYVEHYRAPGWRYEREQRRRDAYHDRRDDYRGDRYRW
jgi:hypothetical protein